MIDGRNGRLRRSLCWDRHELCWQCFKNIDRRARFQDMTSSAWVLAAWLAGYGALALDLALLTWHGTAIWHPIDRPTDCFENDTLSPFEKESYFSCYSSLSLVSTFTILVFTSLMFTAQMFISACIHFGWYSYLRIFICSDIHNSDIYFY